MATTFILSPGYAYCPGVAVENSQQLLEIARSIPLARLWEKCAEYGLTADSPDCQDGELAEILEKYKTLPTGGDTLSVPPGLEILTSRAAGSGSRRWVEERVRRAFMILVLDECFRRGLSVSLAIH